MLYPLRVMMNVCKLIDMDNKDKYKTAAILHDVVEDTNITLDYLKVRGFNDDIVETIDYLTRCENEDYFDFILITKNSPISKRSESERGLKLKIEFGGMISGSSESSTYI
jgi:(p)ppGpp synthase/HD superfamily hydrolase